MDDIDDRLRQFEPVSPEGEPSSDLEEADQLLKLFTRLTRGQWKTRQKADHTAQKVADYLDEHGDRVMELKEERAALEDREEQYQRVLLEIMDLFDELEETAQHSDSSAFRSAATSLREKLERTVGKIGLERIPAEKEEPGSLYHHVVNTIEANAESEQNTIVDVVRPGYLLQGEVLRKADVIVAE